MSIPGPFFNVSQNRLFTFRTTNRREPFFTAAIYGRGGVTCFLCLVAILVLYWNSALPLSVISYLVESSFVLFR
jgi:hypothetical protein